MATSKQKNVQRKHRKSKEKAKAKRAAQLALAKPSRAKREPTTVWNRKPKEIPLGDNLIRGLSAIQASLSLTDPKSAV